MTVRTPAPGGLAPGCAAATLSEWLENRSSPGQIKGAARIVTQSWRRHKKPRRQRAFSVSSGRSTKPPSSTVTSFPVSAQSPTVTSFPVTTRAVTSSDVTFASVPVDDRDVISGFDVGLLNTSLPVSARSLAMTSFPVSVPPSGRLTKQFSVPTHGRSSWQRRELCV